MPKATVRIRAADKSRTYRLLEETVTISGGTLEHDLRLEPTGYVRLFGRIIDGRTGAPPESSTRSGQSRPPE